MKVRLAILGGLLVIATACSAPEGPAYDNQPMDYWTNAWTKPNFVGIHMQKTQSDAPTAECAMGITKAGVGVVVAVGFPVVGTSAWFVFGAIAGSTAAGWDAGQALGECWNEYQQYKTTFDVYTQCPGPHNPTLESTFNEYAQVVAFVNMDFCHCSIACQMGFEDAPGVWLSAVNYDRGKAYWHDGANRLNVANGVDDTIPPPPDFNAMAANMGLTYGGCDNVAEIPQFACP